MPIVFKKKLLANFMMLDRKNSTDDLLLFKSQAGYILRFIAIMAVLLILMFWNTPVFFIFFPILFLIILSLAALFVYNKKASVSIDKISKRITVKRKYIGQAVELYEYNFFDVSHVSRKFRDVASVRKPGEYLTKYETRFLVSLHFKDGCCVELDDRKDRVGKNGKISAYSLEAAQKVSEYINCELRTINI